LIGVLILGVVSNYLRVSRLSIHPSQELSEAKLIKLLVEGNVLKSIFRGYLNQRIRLFLSEQFWVLALCKKKRKRKTTLERIESQESFIAVSA
jgi:hypothetical protein